MPSLSHQKSKWGNHQQLYIIDVDDDHCDFPLDEQTFCSYLMNSTVVLAEGEQLKASNDLLYPPSYQRETEIILFLKFRSFGYTSAFSFVLVF